MPGRFTTPSCPRCLSNDSAETIPHRYTSCIYVQESWEWLKSKLVELDISLESIGDNDLLFLNYPKGLRENAILWLIGVYIETVEKEVVLRRFKLDIKLFKGILKQKKHSVRTQAIPELGIISGIDFEAQGIG